MSLLDRAVVAALPAVPRRIVGRLSSRYIAGPALDDALRTVSELNAQEKLATVDVLGCLYVMLLKVIAKLGEGLSLVARRLTLCSVNIAQQRLQ